MSHQRDPFAISPPRTPPSQTTAYRPKRGQTARPSIRDTFPDVSMEGASRPSESDDGRDPHDLSLSPKHAARTSVVDNMLLSLDQFATTPTASAFDDYQLYNSAMDVDVPGRFRGHTFSSSMSSDAGYGYDDNTRYAPSTVTKSRRSNSSSNHQTLPKRKDSLNRGAMASRSGTMPRNSETRSTNKGSTSTVDYNFPIPRVRADSDGVGRRSDSFDCGPKKYNPYSEASLARESLFFDDDDAAPTPSVPGGPRKLPDYKTPTGPGSRTPVASRPNSVKLSQPPPGRKNRPENIGTGSVKPRDNEYDQPSDADLEPPPGIGSSNNTAPSPTISYHKPAFPQPEPTAVSTTTTISTANNAGPVKERPGFFRRVFGGGASKAASPGPATAVTGSPTSNVSDLSYLQENEVKDSTGATANLKGPKLQPPKSSAGPPATPTRQGPQQVVNKKSSFFRRRKKSVAENVPPPILLPQNLAGPLTLDSMKPEPSPVGSLRKVMNPYLDGAQRPEGKENQGESTVAQRSREGSSAGEAGSRIKEVFHPLSSGYSEDDARQADNYNTGGSSSGNLEKETAISANPPLQAKGSKNGPSRSDGPDEDPRTIRVTTAKSTTKVDPSREEPEGISKLAPPAESNVPESPAVSEASNYQTASTTPVMDPTEQKIEEETENIMDGPGEAIEDGPSAADREKAHKLFESQESVAGSDPAAAWLGDPDRAKVREAYMQLFNWSNFNILAALRSLCDRLVLKGETQQVDRVLDAFSNRWCDCNPSHGFKATDVVHTICYSLLLLNTDLHLADIDQKMTKAQFVRNTMPTIHRVAMDSAPEAFETLRPSKSAKTINANADSVPTPSSTRTPSFPIDAGSASDMDRNGANVSDAGPLVNVPFTGTVRAWEQQIEAVLKDFYTSIQKERLPLYGSQPEKEVYRTQSNNFLGASGTLRRSPSTISKSGSDIYPRGRSSDSRYNVGRWSSKPRSRAGRLYPPSVMGSSRTSLDDQSSVWSPTGSSTWSKYSLGKFTSASVDSFGSEIPRGEYQQSIGFANALSQAIIREDASTYSYEDEHNTTPLLEDETLALAGAPWAKEGSVKHKHHLDAVDKRAKDRNWNECFAVIQQGWMRLFSFNSAKSMRQKAKQRGGVVVGGGNWTENAEEIWKFMLRQTIASALPPPGYSKSRPHVWALSLPTGAVHLFQAGTPEIVREFVSTANYWSARLSKQPLVGGISNIEYGWSDAVVNSALINGGEDRSPSQLSGAARPSIQSSIRSSIDHQTVRPRLPADRVNISDWSPPQQSMAASHHTEEEQLQSLQNYVKNVEDDLQRHNELRPAMNLAFSPRHPNAAKAMANWERKSSYLLREIVKFRTYIDSLRNAIAQKKKILPESNNDTDEKTDVDTAGADTAPAKPEQAPIST